ncbi:hypothetical protein Tco_0590201 [Tanacetum coccineum]
MARSGIGLEDVQLVIIQTLCFHTVISSSTHPITILSDTNVEDAFSSTNTPNYTLASLDYFPASPGNTPSDSSDDLTKYLLALLAISPFHDDPDFTTSETSPFPISSSTDFSAPPHVFEIGESSHKTHLERHEENIETILNHLDELPFERIEHMEDKIEEKIRHDDEIVLVRVRTSTLEILIEDIQIRHRSDMKSLLDKIYELENHKGGPPDY